MLSNSGITVLSLVKVQPQKFIRSLYGVPTTLHSVHDIPVIPSSSAKYLGLQLNQKLNWSVHVSKKCAELRLRLIEISWMIRASNKISLDNKRLLYLALLRPIWVYGIPLWGTAADSHIDEIQWLQNSVLCRMTGAPKSFTDCQLHEEFRLETVHQIIARTSDRYIKRLHEHNNNEALILHEETPIARLKCKPLATIG